MPTYEYKCKVCGNIQEEIHNISELPQVKCLVCNGECEKIFATRGNFVLKGCDWPSQSARIKQQMLEKNKRMKLKMIEREKSGEGVTRVSQINGD